MTEVSAGEKVGVSFDGAERRGEVGAMVEFYPLRRILKPPSFEVEGSVRCELVTLAFLVVWVVFSAFEHVHVGASAQGKDGEVRQNFEGRGLGARCVASSTDRVSSKDGKSLPTLGQSRSEVQQGALVWHVAQYQVNDV